MYCSMDGELGDCGGGGWTLVMKIDGAKVQWNPSKLETLGTVVFQECRMKTLTRFFHSCLLPIVSFKSVNVL